MLVVPSKTKNQSSVPTQPSGTRSRWPRAIRDRSLRGLEDKNGNPPPDITSYLDYSAPGAPDIDPLNEYYEDVPSRGGFTRTIRRYHFIRPGTQFSLPADPNAPPDSPGSRPSPPVTTISRAARSGRFIDYSDGLWNVLCFCGEIYQTKTAELNRFTPGALHCPKPECAALVPRRIRAKGFAARPGASRHIGRTVFRLKVIEWVEGEGWLCECECGALEFCPRSNKLPMQGYKDCPHV